MSVPTTGPAPGTLGDFVVYTAQFGGADPIMPVVRPVNGVDYVVLTDVPLKVPRPWQVRVVDIPGEAQSDRMRNRYCKLHATRLFPQYQRSCYIDTHPQMIGDFTPLLDDFIASGRGVGLMRHSFSHSVAEEIQRSLSRGYITQADHDENWDQQRERQQSAGFADDIGIFRGGLILRDHDQPSVRVFEDAWWAELRAGVTRDQVALPFALWSTGIDTYLIAPEWLRSPKVHRWDHLPQQERYARLIRFFESRVLLQPQYRWVVRLLRTVPAARSGLHRLRAAVSLRWRAASR